MSKLSVERKDDIFMTNNRRKLVQAVKVGKSIYVAVTRLFPDLEPGDYLEFSVWKDETVTLRKWDGDRIE